VSEIEMRMLTSRERQIVRLVSMGKTNREIADELSLAEGTVKEYISRLFRKLDVDSRTELAIWWLRASK
jgi:two-component system, NarL family, response regulator DevR